MDMLVSQNKFDGIRSVKLGPVRFVARQLPIQLSLLNPHQSPTAIIPTYGKIVDANFLRTTIQDFIRTDDVFVPEFLQGIILCGARDSDIVRDGPLIELLQEWANKWIEILPPSKATAFAPGPYIVDGQALFQMWRVYDDYNLAFLNATWPSMDDARSFECVPNVPDNGRALGIIVPSRLYFQESPQLPLNGWRIAVKDNYHLQGTRTSICNRAFNNLYPPQKSTAKCLHGLQNGGVQIVGKLHLSSFALKEDPAECVDYQAPFNPRADRYQTPAGSSSGSGAAAASYDFLDITLATDRSGRRPGLWNGCFALRPSSGRVSSNGIVPLFERFDSPSIMGRDLGRFSQFISSWFEEKSDSGTSTKPLSLVIPSDFWPTSNAEQTECAGSFIAGFNVKALRVSVANTEGKMSHE
ncbi:MAG: hypothetical protein Q9167_006089 [Letrouitia subvulpina]